MHDFLTVGAPSPLQEAGAAALGLGDDTAAAAVLVRQARVAAVPGSSFYSRPEFGRSKLRFSFSKKLATLEEAGRRLSRLAIA